MPNITECFNEINRFALYEKYNMYPFIRRNKRLLYFLLALFTLGVAEIPNNLPNNDPSGIIKAGDTLTLWTNHSSLEFNPDVATEVIAYYASFAEKNNTLWHTITYSGTGKPSKYSLSLYADPTPLDPYPVTNNLSIVEPQYDQNGILLDPPTMASNRNTLTRHNITIDAFTDPRTLPSGHGVFSSDPKYLNNSSVFAEIFAGTLKAIPLDKNKANGDYDAQLEEVFSVSIGEATFLRQQGYSFRQYLTFIHENGNKIFNQNNPSNPFPVYFLTEAQYYNVPQIGMPLSFTS